MNSDTSKIQNNINNETEQVSILLNALNEAQRSVRAFDTKAQIVGIGYIFSLGIVGTVGSLNPEKYDFNTLTIIFAWLIVILPIMQFGSVLYPSRKLAPPLGEKSEHIKHIYHVSMDKVESVDHYLSNVEYCNIKKELAYELIKVSGLRELKRIRFVRGLYLSCFSFLSIFASQIILAIDTNF